MEYGDASKALKQIGEELAVATVLEGAVHRLGDQVRINVQLIDAATEENLWAESYNRELSVEGIFEIQSEIAGQIAAALEATLSAEEIERLGAIPTADFGAYDAYLKGQELLHRDGNLAENLIAARTMFERAVESDPDFALAYTGLSRAARDHYWFAGGPPEALDAAVTAAERALAADPDLPEAHLALGTCHYVRREYGEALARLQMAEHGLPGNSELLLWKAYIMRRLGAWEDALRDLSRAYQIDPRDPDAAVEVGFTLINLRRYDEAEEYLERAIVLAPTYPAAQVYAAMVAVLRDGTVEAAGNAADRIEATAGDPWRYAHGWQVLLYLRDYDRAVAFVSTVERVPGQWYDYPTPLLVGWTRLLQGRKEEAIDFLEQARAILEDDVSARPEDARLHGALGLAYAGLGLHASALLEGRRAVELMPIEKDTFVGSWQLQDLAWIQVLGGDPEAAVESLDRILSLPSVWSIEALLLDPRVDPLREHPAFRALVEKHRRPS
jgi:serine/threonine-protein kinase